MTESEDKIFSEDMSMLKKVKDRIADEVNSATNKFQNMQIIDQLASSLNNQNIDNSSIPNQTLPHPSELIDISNSMPNNNRYNLVDDEPIGRYEEEELNSEISPQHQLFNEQSIKRITKPDLSKANIDNNSVVDHTTQNMYNINEEQQSVIDVNGISSDLEDDRNSTLDTTLKDDVEIDLLSDKEIPFDKDTASLIEHQSVGNNATKDLMVIYKARYKNVVHALRKLNENHTGVKMKLEAQVGELSQQLTSLKTELHNVKQSGGSLVNITSTNVFENDKIASSSSPKPGGSGGDVGSGVGGGAAKSSGGKIRDLEKLIAKCKESLKLKNSQLKILKESLAKVDVFKDSIDDLKSDLQLLRNAHETWTVSIAENKRVMHQEMEEKNVEMDKLRSDIRELQNQVKEGNSKISQHKLVIQNLESRLVQTSAAHQKERESLTKELTVAKNSAIKQVQKEHELQLERVRLDLEKSIEALKSELLAKDEHIIRGAEQCQQAHQRIEFLSAELDESKSKLEENLQIFNELRLGHELAQKESSEMKAKIQEYEASISKDSSDKSSKLDELEKQLDETIKKMVSIEGERDELRQQLDKLQLEKRAECEQCGELHKKLTTEGESYKQSLFDLNARLDLMTTANADQERELNGIRDERDDALESLKAAKLEIEELGKKNESLARIVQDHETEMQSQQEQLECLEANKQELEHLKKVNQSQVATLEQLKLELSERMAELGQSRDEIDKLRSKLIEHESKVAALNKNIAELSSERDSLMANSIKEAKIRQDIEQQLIVIILSAMKNLETPTTSPGSDKGLDSIRQHNTCSDMDDSDAGDGGGGRVDEGRDQNGPNLIGIAEKLSSLAIDRCQAYITANQRLQTVLLENSMMSEEMHRLRDELNTVSKEKSQETLNSIDELESLRTENQALIHDQKTYDDQISSMGERIELLEKQLAQERAAAAAAAAAVCQSTSEVATETTAKYETDRSEVDAISYEMEELRKIVIDREDQIQTLKASIRSNEEAIAAESNNDPSRGPDSTEFEYLKNIVYQFMLGREPLVLARVISAIFKFDNEQVEQICKVQEAVQSVIKPNI